MRILACLTAIAWVVACGGGSRSTSGETGGGSGTTGNGGSGGSDGGSGFSGGPPPNYANNRTTLIRTGDTPSSAVWDALHQEAFVSEPDLGLVDVITVSDAQIVARISVPSVEALGISADSTKILASTTGQKVAWIDTGKRRVTQWQVLPPANESVAGSAFWTPINPGTMESGYLAQDALPTYMQNPYLLSNGKVLFEADLGGFSSAVIEWDPVANTAIVRHDLPSAGPVSANTAGTEVLFGGSPIAYNVTTNALATYTGFQFVPFAVSNPMGTQFAFYRGTSVLFMDTQFNTVGQVTLPPAEEASGLIYSPDGARLYIVSAGTPAIITTIDANSFSVIGTAPGYADGDSRDDGNIETPLAVDNTGLIIGSGRGGVVLDDATDLQSFGQNGAPSARITPTEGVAQGGTVATIMTSDNTDIPAVWFGSQLATGENTSALPQVQAETPAAPVGVVNVKIFEPKGQMTIIPQAFTYGSVPLLTAPIAATPDGGAVVNLYGFGYSVDVSSASPQVMIGASTGKVIAKQEAQGFPVQAISVAVPPGMPGPADIVVRSPTGIATYPKGFRYLESVVDHSSADKLQTVLYDWIRQQLYLNAGDHVDVFSLGANSFGQPIAVPSLGGTRQLQGMALTPDGSKLIVGNFSDDSVAIIDPDAPNSATAVRIEPPIGPGSYPEGPHAVVTTSLNTAFIDVGTTNVETGGGGQIYELNLSTLEVTQRKDLPAIVELSGELMSQSRDGTIVTLASPNNSGGYVMKWSAVTDSWTEHNLGGGYFVFYNDVATSPDGNALAVNNSSDSDFSTPIFLDPLLNQTSELGIESLFYGGNQPGMAFHDSGGLLYSTSYLGVDIIDVLHSSLAERIVLNEAAARLSGSLAVDDTGQQIFLVTDAGLTVIKLDAVPLSVGSIEPSAGPVGTAIRLRGSGFQAGISATLNGTTSTVQFVDTDTLEITVPSIPSGGAALVLTNPDSSSYELDAAFTATN